MTISPEYNIYIHLLKILSTIGPWKAQERVSVYIQSIGHQIEFHL